MSRSMNVSGGQEIPATSSRNDPISGILFQPGGEGQQHRDRIPSPLLQRRSREGIQEGSDLTRRHELMQAQPGPQQPLLQSPTPRLALELHLPVPRDHALAREAAPYPLAEPFGEQPGVEIATAEETG